MSPDTGTLRALFRTTARRLRWADLALGAAIGLIISAALNVIGWPGRGGPLPPFYAGLLGTVETAVFVAAIRTRWRPSAVVAVERATPESRNLLFTAGELIGVGGRSAGHKPFPMVRALIALFVRALKPTVANAQTGAGAPASALHASSPAASLVLDAATALAGRLDPARIVPLARHAALVVASAVIWLASVARVTEGTIVGRATSPVPTVDAIEFTVTPPAHTRRAAQRVKNPDRLSVLEGSRITLAVSSNAASIALATLDSSRLLADEGRGNFTGRVTAHANGFIAVEPRDASGQAGDRRLVGLTVIPDSAPRVRLLAPARDLLVPDGKRTIELRGEATDDIGVTSITLLYTVVSGSGERFEFKEGTVPLVVDSSRATRWGATARWNLESLGLESGDMVVYRAVAGDARPGLVRTTTESDAYLIEVAAPGGVAAAGFAVDPEQERYALSQQMVILKTERLIKKKGTTAQTAYADEAADIGAEQRRVRAEFLFMLGGEMGADPAADSSMSVIDETGEANREDDLAAGREALGGRVAVLSAIRWMSRAARALTDLDVESALTHERAALKQLELAFSRTRIILRALSERERLDSTRRMTGDFEGAANARRAAVAPARDLGAAELRAVLSGVMSLSRDVAANGGERQSGDRRSRTDASRRSSALAERVLRIAPANRELQGVSSALSAAATSMTGSRIGETRAQLQRAAAAVNGILVRSLPAAPGVRLSLDAAQSRGALVESLNSARLRGAAPDSGRSRGTPPDSVRSPGGLSVSARRGSP